ncbi:AAA family ATPase [Streptomyces sp. NPDC050546]|uniref:AAA family ATPase n=1 Tax=Streptomyces sp. NPDC050546 TaxID=3365628 RepID=UPI0037B1FF68
MAHWHQLLDELLAEGGPARGLEVVGEAWSGKTRRLDELTRRAAQAGWAIARGRPGRLHAATPFGLFLDALDDPIAAGGEELRSRLTEEEEHRLAALFPSLSPGTPGARSHRDLYRECRAVRGLLGHLAGSRGLVLVLDDLHRADNDSLDLLGYLIQRPPAGPVLIAVAHRPRQLAHQLLGALGEAVARGFSHRVELAPHDLDDPDLHALLPPDLDARTRRSLLRRSGGNPGLLLALNAMTRRAPAGTGSTAIPAEPPDAFVLSTLTDLQALSPAGWSMARAAAVLGDAFALRTAAEVAQLDGAGAGEGLDELLAEDLVRPLGEGTDFRFRDPVVRAVAYHSAGRGWRSGAHARAAASLRTHGGLTELRAQQLLYAVEVADDDDVRALVEAAEDTVLRDPAAALRWSRHALRPTVTADPLLRARASAVLGRALLLDGELEECAAVFQRLLTSDPRLPAAVRGTVVESYTHVHRLLGRPEAARELLRTELAGQPGAQMCDRACAGLCGPADRESATLAEGSWTAAGETPCFRIRLAMTGLVLETGGGWSRADRDALAALASRDDNPARPSAMAALAAAEAQFGRSSAAAEHALAAAELLDALPDDEMAAHLEALHWLSGAELFLGRLREAEQHLVHGTELARRFGQRHLLGRLLIGLGHVRQRLGYYPEALGCAGEAEAVASAMGSTPLTDLAQRLREELDMLQGVRVLDHGTSPGPQLPGLSSREQQISVLVSRGHTNQRIAHSLDLSPKTVETYLARIFKKLSVSSRTEVAAMVGRAGGTPPPGTEPALRLPAAAEPVPSARPLP